MKSDGFFTYGHPRPNHYNHGKQQKQTGDSSGHAGILEKGFTSIKRVKEFRLYPFTPLLPGFCV